MIRDAEASKAQILQPRGNVHFINNHINTNSRRYVDDGYESDEQEETEQGNFQLHQHHPAVVDEDYLVVGNFVEEHIRQRIENGEYVDFSRLLPRDCLLLDEENRMAIINRNGHTFFVPASDADPASISNFSQWEQAFHVFSNIYTKKFPGHTSELIQYNHIIHTAALTYTWENVYLYDRNFRFHLSRYPHRSWAVILQ